MGLATQDQCPECEMQWSYMITDKSQKDCDDAFCEQPWIGKTEPKGHNAHCWIEGRRGPFYRLIGVQYPYDDAEYYDGISEYRCPSCGTRWGRWTGTKIADGHIESRYGHRGHVLEESREKKVV